MSKPRGPKKNNSDTVLPAVSPSPNPAVEASSSGTIRTEQRQSSRKPVIVKTETRANLIPINLEDEIRSLAYLISERRGFEPGHETEDWLAAETEVRQRYRQQTA